MVRMAKKEEKKRKDRDAVEIKRTITLPNGMKKEKSFYGKTRNLAIKSYEKYLVNQSKEEQKKSIHYFADAADGWLETKEGVQQITYNGYKYKVDALKEVWPDTLIDEITNADIKIKINKITKSKGLGQDKKASKNTIKKYINYLYSIFEFAIDNDMLGKNPMKKTGKNNIKVPVTAKKPKNPRWYTQDQERIILDHAKTQGINGLTVFIPLKIGTRPGETMAFNPSRDIDFVNKTVHIQETVKAADPERKTGETKTETSDRIYPVDDDEFYDHIASFNFSGYIFDNGKGVPKNYNNWYNHNYKRFMDTLPPDVPRLNPHEMRHTHGTLLYERGVDFYTIMKVMGHSDIKVTQIYVHHSIELIRKKIKRKSDYNDE